MALAFDAVSSANGDGGNSPLTWSHTCSGADRALIVSIEFAGLVTTISGVTYAGVAMSLIGTYTVGARDLSQWKLSNPASGANNVSVSYSDNGGGIQAGAISFTGAEQTTANLTGTQATNTGTDDSPTVNVSSATGEIVVDIAATNDDLGGAHTLTAGAGQTKRWGFDVNDQGSTAGSTEAGAASVTMSWTSTGNIDNWSITGVSVKPTSSSPQTLTPTAIGSAEAFGSDQLNFALLANAIASAEAFGADQLNLALLMNAIESAEAFGTLTMGLYVLPVGIPGEEAFGTAFIFFPIDPTGIPSGEAFGTLWIFEPPPDVLGFEIVDAGLFDFTVEDEPAIGQDYVDPVTPGQLTEDRIDFV